MPPETEALPALSPTTVIPVQRDDEVSESSGPDADVQALQRCGYDVPAAGLDACVHSAVVTLCCVCAGCANEVWWCGRPVPVYDQRSNAPWVRRAKWAGIALAVFMVASGWIVDLFWAFVLIAMMGTIGIVWGVLELVQSF